MTIVLPDPALEGADPSLVGRAVGADDITPLDRWLDEQQRLTPVERFAKHHDEQPQLEGRWRDLIPSRAPSPGEQYAFDVDLDACTGCKACVSACHSLNGLDEGESWRAVGLLVGGPASDPVQQNVTAACHHCLDPACLTGCPVDAYEKDPVTGVVRHLDDQCIGCSYCTLTCPYEVPRYHESLGIVRKCDLCVDRLQAGEAPACAQACPTEAIRVQLVDVAELRRTQSSAPYEQLVPTAPLSRLTTPTTTYRTKRGLPRGVTAADSGSVVPAHGHPPLVAMLVLTQLAVGVSIALAALRVGWPDVFEPLATPGAVTTALVGAIALGASVLHLGRPLLAWRAVLGIGHSWLSREIVAFGAFGALAAVVAGSRLLDLPLAPGVEGDIAVAVVGAAAVATSVLVYVVCGKRWWSGGRTTIRFGATTTGLGCAVTGTAITALAATARLDPSGALDGAAVLFSLALIASMVACVTEAGVLRHRRRGLHDELGRTASLLTGPLASLAGTRLWLLGFQGLLGMIAISLALNSAADAQGLLPVAVLFTLTALAGEAIARHLFFVAVSSDRMPGSPA